MAKKTKKEIKKEWDEAVTDRFTSGYVFANLTDKDGNKLTDEKGKPIKNAKKGKK